MTMGKFLFADLPASAPGEIGALFLMWREKRLTNRIKRGDTPMLSDFTDDELSPYAGNLAIARFSEALDDVFVEASGAAIVDILGVDLTGQWLTEAFAEPKLSIAQRPYRAAARVGRPTYSTTLIDQSAEIARLIMPVVWREGGVAFLVGVYRYRIVPEAPEPRTFFQGSDVRRRKFLILKTDLATPQDKKRELARVLRRVDSPARSRRRAAAAAERGDGGGAANQTFH